MTTKQRAFCREYIRDFNATRAAIRAGYSKTSARWIGSQLLQKTHILEWIERMEARATAGSLVRLQDVVDEQVKIVFGNVADFLHLEDGKWRIDLQQCDRDHMAAIREVSVATDGTVTLKLHDKVRAGIALGQHLGGYKNRTELSTPPGQPLELNDVSIVEATRRIARAMKKGMEAQQRLDAETPELEVAADD